MAFGSSTFTRFARLAVAATLLTACAPSVEETDPLSSGSSGDDTGASTGAPAEDQDEPTMLCNAMVDELFGDVCHDDYCEPVDACAMRLSCSIAGALEASDADAFFACLAESASPSSTSHQIIEACETQLPINPACEAACARVETCHPEDFASKYSPESGRSCVVECSVQETAATLECLATETCEYISIPRSGTLGGHACGCEQGDWGCTHPSLEAVCG